MLESVPPVVEAAIYCYFVAVAAIGCYLHGRAWLRYRNRDARIDEQPGLEG
ncbi:hypothetical protein [Natronorubrum halalkaliphilum]|uniref:hypothetical protein n=1 Tax=Natronorubrum halalkaliphilum TaxID=2691917 RepID=UPI00191617DC|nr:hypothetical protein [Natronorubrum halalkaliphilum]